MIHQKFSDVVLTEEDRDDIERKIVQVEFEVYNGDMPSSNKQLLRRKLERETREAIWEARDYTWGQDEGVIV